MRTRTVTEHIIPPKQLLKFIKDYIGDDEAAPFAACQTVGGAVVGLQNPSWLHFHGSANEETALQATIMQLRNSRVLHANTNRMGSNRLVLPTSSQNRFTTIAFGGTKLQSLSTNDGIVL
jgi:hypothetical protein